MEIREKNGYFLLKCANTKVALAYDRQAKIKDAVSLSVNAESDDGFNVLNAGEYEVAEVFVMVIAKNGARAFLVDVCDVNILLLPKKIDLTDKEIEQLGQIDILVLGSEIDINNDLVKYVGKIDPQLLLLQKSSNIDEYEKVFGAEVIKVSKKIKVKSSEFDNEEYKLQLMSIE